MAYEVLAPLSAGGMGEVYRARDPRLNREVDVESRRRPRPGEFPDIDAVIYACAAQDLSPGA